MRILAIALGLTVLMGSVVPAAEAASKAKGRSGYSKEQQAKFFDQALGLCRKKYGTSLHYVKVDYSKGTPRYWCYHY